MKEDREGKVSVDSTQVGGATVAAVYSPRSAGTRSPSWSVGQLDEVVLSDFTVHTAVDRFLTAIRGPSMPHRSCRRPAAEGHEIPVARSGHARASAVCERVGR
jgi:hypothetical protein